MTQRVVVDTDVVSFYSKNDSRFASYAPALAGNELVISFMTLSELLLWQRLRSWGETRRREFLDEIRRQYIIYPVDEPLCHLWADLKTHAKNRGRALENADAWIAATALQLEAPLVTHNERDFQFLPELRVVSESAIGAIGAGAIGVRS